MLAAFFGFRRLKVGGIIRRLLHRLSRKFARTRYAACWTEDDGVYFCGHKHKTVAESMKCLVPDGRSFIRAFENGVSRSLMDEEFQEFLIALKAMPWRHRKEPQKRGF